MPLKTNSGNLEWGRRWLGRLSLPLCGLLPVVALAAALQPERGTQNPVAVVFPLTYSAEATLAALGNTGAHLVAPGGIGAVFIVQSDAPDLADQLYRAGAWLILKSDAAWCQPITR